MAPSVLIFRARTLRAKLIAVLVASLWAAGAGAQTKVTDAQMMTATNGQFYITVMGDTAKAPQQHRPGVEEGTGNNPVNVDLVEAAFERETLLAVKEKEAIGPGRRMILSYVLTLELDNGAQKKFDSRDRDEHKVWFDPDGLNPPPTDSKGRQWFEFQYDDSDPRWKKNEQIGRHPAPFGGVNEAQDGRTRMPFLTGAPGANSTTKNSVQYFRRKLILWGKPSTPTHTPEKTFTYTPAPTKPPVPTPTVKPSVTISPTRTFTSTFTFTFTQTFTKTYTLTPKPDEPTWTPSETPLPSLSPTPFLTDTPVPSEPPTIPPTPAETYTPSESPLPTEVPPTFTPTTAPGVLILGFESERELELRNGGYASVKLSKGPLGLSQGKACGEYRFRIPGKIQFTPTPDPRPRAGATPRPYVPVLYLHFEGPAKPSTTDYSDFKLVSLDVTNPGRMPVNVTLGLGDAKGFQMTFKAQGAESGKLTAIQGLLDEARAQRLDLSKIQYLSVAVDVTGHQQDPVLYFDNLRLE